MTSPRAGGDLASVSATVTLTISSSHNIEDGASNDLTNTAPTGTNDNSYVLDNTAPSVTISGVPSASNAPFTATFTFSEAVTGFAVGDITLGNATASSFTVTSTTVYTALVTPTADGAVTVDVPANAAQEAAGNGNTAATRASSTYAVPAITIVAGTSPVTEGTSAVFTLSRTGSPTAALAVNVTVSETGGDMVAAANEGDRTVTFLANAATATLSVTTASDNVDEANSVVTATISADTGSPASYSVGTPASAMVTVEDNDTRDVTVSTAALTVNEGTMGTYTVVLDSQPTANVMVTPSRTGSSDVTFSPPTLTFTASTWDTVQPVTVTAAQDNDAVNDSATISHAVTGGDYAGVTVESVVVTVDDDETADTTAPRVASITRQNPTVSPTNADSLTWRVTFSEAVSNVDAADFVVSGTTATVTAVAAVTGAYDVTASGGNLAGVSATVGLAIAASHNIQDGASNALSNTAPTGTNDNSYVVDNTAPTVTISGVPATSDAPFTATFTFPEAVTGFVVGRYHARQCHRLKLHGHEHDGLYGAGHADGHWSGDRGRAGQCGAGCRRQRQHGRDPGQLRLCRACNHDRGGHVARRRGYAGGLHAEPGGEHDGRADGECHGLRDGGRHGCGGQRGRPDRDLPWPTRPRRR